MLRSMREGAKEGAMKYILLGFLVLATGGLVLTDVGGFFRGGVGATDVAKAGPVTIDIRDFDRNVRRILQQEFLTPQEAYRDGLLDGILRNEINVRLLALETHEKGIRVSNDEVMRQIGNMIDVMSTTEESRKAALQRMLRQQGISEGEFIEAIRQETSTRLLQQALQEGTGVVPPGLIDDLYQFESENRTLQIVHFKNNEITDFEEPTEEQLQKFYEASKLKYVVPEKRTFTIAYLSDAVVEDRIEITEDDIRAEYDASIDSFAIPARRTIQQAVLQDEEDAMAVFEQVQSGTNMKAAVTDVMGKADNYLGEDEFEEGGLVEEIAGPAFSANKGDLLEPIRTPLGWHVLKIINLLEEDAVPYADVKKDLREQILFERLSDELLDTANEIDDALAGGEDFKAVVDQYGLTTEQFKNIRQSGMNEKDEDAFKTLSADRADILADSFDYEEGEVTPIMELVDGRFIAIQINKVQESSFTPYEDVKADLGKSWISQQKQLMNRARAQDAFAAIQDGSKKLADVGKAQTFKNLTRNDAKKAPLSNAALEQAFDLDGGASFLTPTPDGFAIAKVTSVSLKAPDKADKNERGNVRNAVFKSLPQEMTGQFMTTISNREKVRVNRELLDSTYGGNQDAY